MASKVENHLNKLAETDRRAAIFAAAQCARTALEVVPPGEALSLRLIEGVEAWVRGELSADDVAALTPAGAHYSVAAISTLARAVQNNHESVGTVASQTAHTRAAVATKLQIRSQEFRELRSQILRELFEIAKSAQ